MAMTRFDGFTNVWTPVAMARDLRVGAPLGVRVADTPVVLFRDASGAAAAMIDRCPHRGVALSLGRVKDGCIECPFHGWRFDASGRACHVPWNPDAKLDHLAASALPAREVGGQLWIYTGVAPASEPFVPPALLDPAVRVIGEPIVWATHWTRAMENMLDWPHLPFVHRKTIGRTMQPGERARMDLHWEQTEWGATSQISIDGEKRPGRLDFRWPNGMTLYIPISRRIFLLQVACIPIDERTTKMLLVTARDFMRAPFLDWLFHMQNRRIATEDQAIVESSWPVEMPPATEELSVRTDALTLHFRKRYFAELREKKKLRVATAASA